MELINYKSVDHENIFSFNDLVDFDLVLNSFQEKIIQLKENSLDLKKIKCIIDLGKRKISANELFNLFDIILNEEFILINKINCLCDINSQVEIFEGTVRGGQYLSFASSVLLLGDVNPNATIVAKNNIYIVGKAGGKLISISKDSKISASSFSNCLVQIYDSNLEIINEKESSTLKYQEKKIENIKNNNLKGENNVKSNCSYIR